MTELTELKPRIQLKIKPRIGLLAVTCFGVFFTVAKLVFQNDATIHTVKPLAFPATVVLSGNKMWESQALTDTVVQQSRQYDAVISGRRYRYRYQNIPLDIEMRYVVGTLGNVEGMIYNNTNLKLPMGKIFQTVRQQPGVGYYGLFAYKNQAYLSSCINPQGESTVSTEQFLHNRHIYNLRFRRLLPWLLGEESFFDRRCLWAHLSTPVNNSDYQSAYQRIEKAWFDCYRWWNPRFPKP
ncbi:MAG: cyanoexosortase A system-associated protein [Aulosira sp. DedQUE10]|nr:cyanoexosortase A system-associated protein [Aulosira sp. DedQUE10]